MTKYYVTTPIYYVNSDPHIGTAYTTVLADTAARYHKILGQESFFLTGTDEHGDKIAQSAARKGLAPQEFVDQISEKFQILWPKLLVRPDRFIRTTDPQHSEVVRQVLQKLHDKGETYFGEYEGLYCTGCERFRTEKELVDGKCPDHGTEPERIKESNYFFRMSRFQDWWIDYIEKHPDVISPERYKNEVLGFLREPLEDLCISRPKSRLTWGIELPFDKEYVTYVWFDALLNYLSGINCGGSDLWQDWWAQSEHLIGKDILKPHGVYWPIMLHAAGFPVFKRLTVHGYWNFRDAKISKSSGKPVGTEPLLRVCGADALRYFLLREMVVGLDASFSVEAMVKRINSDLANDLGNLFSRVAKLIADYCDGKIPASADRNPELCKLAETLSNQIPDWVADHKWHVLLEEVMQFVRATNRYFESSAPWNLVKTDTSAAGAVLYNCVEALRITALAIYPVMPGKMTELLSRMGEPIEKFELKASMKWGQARTGAAMQKGDALFPRIDETILPALLPEFFSAQTVAISASSAPEAPLLNIEDFRKLDLRSAVIKTAERISGSDKLLKLTVTTGDKERQIVAGIAQQYSPEQMVGKHIVIVANLKPAKLRGELSEGMLLAVKWDDELRIIEFPSDVPPGATIS